MTRLTPVFLVLLRLAIGWHIFFEGFEKIQDPSWSSAGYLREAAGPLAGPFQELGGDPVLDRMTLRDASEGAAVRERLPAGLAKEWQSYLDQFSRYYKLDDEQKQIAQNRLAQREEITALWLIQGKETVKKATQFGVVEVEKTTPQRVAEYRRALETYYQKKEEAGRFPEAGAAVAAAARTELARQRSELLAALNAQTAEMKAALQTVLTDQQKGMDPMVVAAPSRSDVFRSRSWLNWGRLEWSDFIVRWGLPIVGLCLLLGLFTRTACIAGVVFLVLFYLPMPPWPGLPDNPRTEGHYLYISKNVIEMLALLALATTRSGRWLGLDALFPLCCGGNAKITPPPSPELSPPVVPEEARSPVPAEEPASRRIPMLDPVPDETAAAPPADNPPERGDPTIIYSPKEE